MLEFCSLNIQSCQRTYKENIFPWRKMCTLSKKEQKVMTTKWSGRLLEWGTSENSAETGDSPVFHGTMIWQIVKGLGPQQKASSSGNTNKHIHQPASVSSFSALTCNVWESNDVCRNQHDFLDAPDKQFYSNESWVPGTTGSNCWCWKQTHPKKFSNDTSMRWQMNAGKQN